MQAKETVNLIKKKRRMLQNNHVSREKELEWLERLNNNDSIMWEW